MTEAPTDRRGWRWRAALQLFALCGFAFAQPFFEATSESREYFAARDVSFAEAALFGALLTTVPPALLLGGEVLLRRIAPSARRLAHRFIIGALMALIACQFLARISVRLGESGQPRVSGVVVLLLSAALGVLFVVALRRWGGVESWLAVLAPAPVVFFLIFLADAPGPIGEPEAAARVERPVPVVLVVFDEFPTLSFLASDGNIDERRFPNLARFARDATWYRNATTVNDSTNYAVPAILSGRRPSVEARPDQASFPDNLFTRLSETHDYDVVEPFTSLCSVPACRIRSWGMADRLLGLAADAWHIDLRSTAPADFESRLPTLVSAEKLGSDPERHLDRFLSGIRDSPKPLLAFAHLLLPHQPWLYLPDGRRYGEPDAPPYSGFLDPDWVDDRWTTDLAWQRHLLQAGYADRQLGRIVKRLRDTDLFDRSLVIFVADHGMSFHPDRPGRYVDQGNVHEIASVPLFVKLPGQQRRRVVNSAARTVDVLPTVSAYMGILPVSGIDGRALATEGGDTGTSVSVDSARGGTARIPWRTFLARRRRTLSRQHELFGEGSWQRVYRYGRPPPGFPEDEGSLRRDGFVPIASQLDQEGALGQVRRESGTLPAVVTGHLLDPTALQDSRVAVVLNGVVEAFVPIHSVNGETRFGAILEPSHLRSGANAVELYGKQRSETR